MRRLLDAFWARVFAGRIDRERKRGLEKWPR